MSGHLALCVTGHTFSSKHSATKLQKCAKTSICPPHLHQQPSDTSVSIRVKYSEKLLLYGLYSLKVSDVKIEEVSPHLCDDGEGLEPGHPVQEPGQARHLRRVLRGGAQRQLQVLQPAIHLASPSLE